MKRRHFIQSIGLGAIQLGLLQHASTAWASHNILKDLPRISPELKGISTEAILNFINEVEADALNLHSLMVVKGGHVIAEGWWAPYQPDLKHTLYSLSKSFTSTAIGLAVQEGKISVEDKVIAFFKDDLPETVSENLAAMRIKDLLTMTSGHTQDTMKGLFDRSDSNWVKGFLAQAVNRKPGTHFVYNSGATYMLSAIIEKVTGSSLLKYLQPRLFDPLKIEGADWEVDPKGIDTGGWGLRLKTEDIAKFGQLYLQKGVWNGKRILSESWIDEATTATVPASIKPEDAKSDWLRGYGYQFWRCQHNAYRGDGAFGQYCVVIPEHDMVIAITSESSNMQAILNLIWKHLIPIQKRVSLKRDKTSEKILKQRLAGLELKPLVSTLKSDIVSKINHQSFKFESNTLGVSEVKFDFQTDFCKVSIVDAEGRHDLNCGLKGWKLGTSDLPTLPLKLAATSVPNEKMSKVAVSGKWETTKHFQLICRFIETAHYELINFQFIDNKVSMSFVRSLSVLDRTEDKRPKLTGILVE